MEELLLFFGNYGTILSLIALGGILLLGLLKYLNVFSKIEKERRKILYLLISVGLSITGAIIYLAIVDQLDVDYIAGFSAAIFALNQTFYAIYETTTLRELVAKIIDWLTNKVSEKHNNVSGQ